MVASLIVEDEHFEYLREQKGSIRDLAADRAAWMDAYQRKIDADFAGLLPYLPNNCGSILDIGGGIGGIDVLLARKFGDECHVSILDGECDPPAMRLHAKTFNHMRVTEDFLKKNGVGSFDYFTPDNLAAPRPFDLIISTGSWCFHYPPKTYLKFVRACCHSGTTLIVDVRRNKPKWREKMDAAFCYVAVIRREKKYDRVVFHNDEHQISRGLQGLVA